MTPNDDLPAALRLQLRSLRTDLDPPPALWDGIAARLDAVAQRPAAPRRRPVWPMALAATVAVAALAGGWALPQLRPTGVDAALADAHAALDRDARSLRAALAQDPDSALLLHQLSRVDALRQTLDQRATL